jgi:hypothetical protein
MVHINDLPFLGDAQVTLGILSSYVDYQPPYLTWTIFPPSSFIYIFMSFNKRVMQLCEDIMGPRFWEFIQGSLVRY